MQQNAFAHSIPDWQKMVGQSKCKEVIAASDVLCQINHTEYRKQHKYAKKKKKKTAFGFRLLVHFLAPTLNTYRRKKISKLHIKNNWCFSSEDCNTIIPF